MQPLLTALEKLKIRGFIADSILTVAGLLFLLLYYHIYAPDLSRLFNMTDVHVVIWYLVVSFASYGVGALLVLFAKCVMFFCALVLRVDRIPYGKNIVKVLHTSLKGGDVSGDTFLSVHNPLFSVTRTGNTRIVMELLLSFSLWASYAVTPYFLIVSLFIIVTLALFEVRVPKVSVK